MPEVIEKRLSANDVGETGAHQSGPYIGTSGTVPGFFPELDLNQRDPHLRMTFLDSSGRRYHFEFRYWTAKDEYHLSHMTGFFRDHNVSSGDVLILRRDDDGTLHVGVRAAGEPREGTVVRPEGAWSVLSLPGGGTEADAAQGPRGEPGPEADPEEQYLGGLPEGAKNRVVVNRYERSPENRRRCLEFHGTSCHACGIDFGNEYGDIGDGFIHVHHVTPLPALGEGYVIDPTQDLIPVCPNCHAMLHRRTPPYTVDELRTIRDRAGRPDE